MTCKLQHVYSKDNMQAWGYLHVDLTEVGPCAGWWWRCCVFEGQQWHTRTWFLFSSDYWKNVGEDWRKIEGGALSAKLMWITISDLIQVCFSYDIFSLLFADSRLLLPLWSLFLLLENVFNFGVRLYMSGSHYPSMGWVLVRITAVMILSSLGMSWAFRKTIWLWDVEIIWVMF